MLLNRRSEYAILGLIYLAKKSVAGEANSFSDVGEVAAATAAPPNLLRVLFYKLAKDGLLRSQRGVRGGFVLGRRPAHITLRQIVESVQGPVGPFSCVTTDNEPDDCNRFGTCELYGVLRRMRNRVIEELEGTTLADLVSPNSQRTQDEDLHTFAA